MRQPAPHAASPAPTPPAVAAPAPAEPLLALQRSAGNQAVGRALARMPAEEFNAGSITNELRRAIDQNELSAGWKFGSGLTGGLHATQRKVDAGRVITALDKLSPEQVEAVKALYRDWEGTELTDDLFGEGKAKTPSNLTADQAARIRALLRGTEQREGQAAPQGRVDADAAELHELLSADLDEAGRERLMALHRPSLAEIGEL